MIAQGALWALAGAALAVAGFAALAERRRTRRRDIDQVGWMPWTLIQVLAMLTAALAAAYAING